MEQPEKVAAIHQAYLDAGAQILLTNTFGGTRFRLALHKAEERVAELNRRRGEAAAESGADASRTSTGRREYRPDRSGAVCPTVR